MHWTSGERLLGVGLGLVGLASAVDRVRQPQPSVMESIAILVGLLVVVEVLTRATAAIEVTSEAVHAVGSHTVRTIPLGGVTEVERRGDGVRLALVDGQHIDLDPPVSRWGDSDASHAAAALAHAIDSARRAAPQFSTVAGLRRQPRLLSIALIATTVGVAVWLVLDRWFL
jgi:xanthosine utilization system XapX-like protein